MKITKKEIQSDLGEIYNNLVDDLALDFENGDNGYSTYKESYNAIKKYTLKTLRNKMIKYGMNDNGRKRTKLQEMWNIQ